MDEIPVTQPEDTRTCPRCARGPVQYGALSRTDTATLVCGTCGTEEHLIQFMIQSKKKELRQLLSKFEQRNWPIGVDRG